MGDQPMNCYSSDYHLDIVDQQTYCPLPCFTVETPIIIDDTADVKRYIRYITDRRLISLGLKGIMKVKKNPLPWVEEMINAPTHTNFFENRATDYAKGALQGSWSDVWAH